LFFLRHSVVIPDTDLDISVRDFTEAELTTALKQNKLGKAAGVDVESE